MSDTQRSNGGALVRWVGLAMGLPALIAVALLSKDAVMVINGINQDALKRETAALERGLKMLGELHASELLSHAMWDEAFRNVVLSEEKDWIRANFGSQALVSDGAQKLLIVGPDGKAIFSSEDDGAPAPERAASLLAPAVPAMERARKLYRKAHAAGGAFGERLAGAMTDGVYVNDMVRVDGHPAMVTVAPFLPGTEDHAAPDEPTLLVGIQHLTAAVLDKLETLSHIEGLEHVHETHTETTGEHAHAVRDARGNAVTHLTWEFSAPGDAVLWAAAPAIAVSLSFIVLLTLLAAATMRRLTRRLAESEKAAIHASRHDPATGLANRGWFMRVFEELLGSSGKQDGTHAVLLIDCDHFKTVNDTLGHAAGDAVLRAIAERLKALDRRPLIAARLGGDEFALVSPPLAGAADAAAVLEGVEAALMQPVPFEAFLITVSVSIGAHVFEVPSSQPIDALLAKADLALYRAKHNGRGCSRLYDPAIDTGELMPELPVARHTPDAAARAA